MIHPKYVSMLVAMAGIAGLASASEAQVILVENGEPHAVVVIADHPTRTAQYAADELVRHVEKATGVMLEIAPESKAPDDMHTRIYIGETETAYHFGIDVNSLPREMFVLRSIGNDLFIAGREDDGDPLNPSNPNAGTLFGVYEFLEEVMKVRWLWPGELGTYVPKTGTISVSSINRMQAPDLPYRHIRWGYTSSVYRGASLQDEDIQLGFSQETAEKYGEAMTVLLRRHRMGGRDLSSDMGVSHTYSGWWQRYGEQHPEWFMMRRDGGRGRLDPNRQVHVEVCVTNEELQDYIIEQWNGESTLMLGVVDRSGRCNCENCRAWDGPQPDPIPWFARYVYETDFNARNFFPGATSDRYARFWKTMHKKAQKINPNAKIGVFLYHNEFPAPVTDIPLNKNIYGQFVQWQDPHLRWFPMHEEAYEWVKEQWLGWRKTGIRMGYRPNYLHDGYVMPHFETRQSGDFFKFAHQHGMMSADFDSNTGQWAVQGPRLYMHMRLVNKPGLDIDEIRDEYFSAFGPAADDVRRYFDFWEQYAFDNILPFLDLFDSPLRYLHWPRFAHKAFPPEVLDIGAEILEQALLKTRNSPTEYAERVKFLLTGLEHARLTVELAAVFDGHFEVPENRLEDAGLALNKLVRFRKEHQDSFFSDLWRVTNFWERPRWNMDGQILDYVTE